MSPADSADAERPLRHHFVAELHELEVLLRLDGADAARLAIRSLVAGHALERISDHATILGRRIQYLITGDPVHLAAEVR
jgi:phosphate uptake regulator